MPTRLLREGILDSEAVNSLSIAGEVFYRRLMSIVDDFGRYDARVPLLRARLFGLKLDQWPEEKVDAALKECGSAGLVVSYTVKGKDYLEVVNFGQRTRSASRFPPPPGSPTTGKSSGKVYFIRATESGRIKIGFSSWKVESRLSALQTGTPERLELIGWVDGSREDEKSLHRRFKHLAIGGEWFEPDEELLDYIDECAAADGGAQWRATARQSPPYSETEAYSETETKAETDCDWSPFPDAEFAINAILDAYPQETGKTSARGYWREFLDKAQVNAPRQARAMLAAAQLIRERCPPDKIQFLPNARKFIAESWADNWERISEQWQTPQKEGSLTAAMRAIEEAGRRM